MNSISNICKFDDCIKVVHGHNMCNMHYRRWRKSLGFDLYEPKPPRDRTKNIYQLPEYRHWIGIKMRIKKGIGRNEKYYSDKSIGISKEWLDFNIFYKDMGQRPSPNHSIDRIDNSKGYSKENCRWATRYQQTLNRGKNTNNVTGYIGVGSVNSRWGAFVTYAYTSIYIATYDTKEEAAWMRDQYMLELHSDMCITNFEYK